MSHMKMMMRRTWISTSEGLYSTWKTCSSCFGGCIPLPCSDGKSHAFNTEHAMPVEQPAPACSNGAFSSGLNGMSKPWVYHVCH